MPRKRDRPQNASLGLARAARHAPRDDAEVRAAAPPRRRRRLHARDARASRSRSPPPTLAVSLSQTQHGKS